MTHRGGAAATQPRILVVDDDAELAELLGVRLMASGYDVTSELGAQRALARVGRERIDAVLLDLRLADGDGLDVLSAIRERSPDLPVIILTAHGTIDTAVEAMRRGAYGFLTKPFLDHELVQKLGHAIENVELRREVAGLRRIVGSPAEARLLGTSPAIQRLREAIARVAPSDATVLLLGESGTGKELAARSLHDMSSRAKGPFVAVNCAALTPELLESTLFGHTKGAFTGASGDRHGIFGAARRGTVFLDEIGEAPMVVQAKLLRVLQERRFTRVGTTEEEDADVRVLAATNRDLRAEVAERHFREDLYYRLAVVTITTPPLRDRPEDVPLLAKLFLERAAARNGLPLPAFSGGALAALQAHDWPGNVRELANVIEAALLLAGGTVLGAEHFPQLPTGESARPAERVRFGGELREQILHEPEPSVPTLKEARDGFERSYLTAILERTNGSVTAAARLAGRNRSDFYDLLRRHGLSVAAFKA